MNFSNIGISICIIHGLDEKQVGGALIQESVKEPPNQSSYFLTLFSALGEIRTKDISSHPNVDPSVAFIAVMLLAKLLLKTPETRDNNLDGCKLSRKLV